MPEDHFGPDVARRYDEDSATMFAPEVLEPALDRLQALARGGAALELAIGTGRVGLALAARGVPVTGIELSEAMVAELRSKPGGAELPVVVGDMATTRVEGEFSLVYLVFNTLVNLTSQDAQVDCFCNAAAHLAPGGRFVVEVGVPQIQRLGAGETAHAFALRDGYAGISTYDVATQQMANHHFNDDAGDGRYRRRSIPFRYVWPAELDLMARIAGLALESRHGDWTGGPFTSTSTTSVAVWAKPA
jgi:SAM-dependent methyltransferase